MSKKISLSDLNDVLPTYADVADEEYKWSPKKILEMYDDGMDKIEIGAELRVSDYTVFRIVQERSKYEGHRQSNRITQRYSN